MIVGGRQVRGMVSLSLQLPASDGVAAAATTRWLDGDGRDRVGQSSSITDVSTGPLASGCVVVVDEPAEDGLR